MTDQLEYEEKEDEGFISFLRSEYFVLITFVSIIAPLMMHTAYLLLQVSNIQNEWYSYFFAFSFDLAIFVFAIHGRRSQATGLAFIVFTLNVCFFNMHTLSKLFSGEPLTSEEAVKLFVTTIISGAGSWIVHSYVVFFNEWIGEKKEIKRLLTREMKKDEMIRSLQASLDSLSKSQKQSPSESIDIPMALLNGQIQFPHTCMACEQTVPTVKSLEGLVKFCKNRNCRYKINGTAKLEELRIANQ